MTEQEFQQLVQEGVLGDPDAVSWSLGRVWDTRRETEYCFSPTQARRAQDLGIEVIATLPGVYEPFHDAGGRPRVVDGVACQLDVLGTRTGSQGEVEDHLALTHRALTAASKWQERLPEQVAVRWFTDKAVMASGDSSFLGSAATAVLLVAASIQLELALHGLAARGGIAPGPLFADQQFMYGQAVNDAYHLESRLAHYPRVVLHEELLEPLRSGTLSPIAESLVAIDHDRLPFVSYLGLLNDPNSDLERPSPELLGEHRAFIVEQLAQNRTNPRVRAKYGWLAD